MYGDIIYVEREPLLWRSAEQRRNPESKKLDLAIYRMTKYRHYGIDLGNNQVAHFYANSIWERANSEIIISSIEEFTKDGRCQTLQFVPFGFTREEVVERALGTVGTNFGGYSILENNCEHFAMWCATGSRASNQYVLLKNGITRVSKPIAPIRKKVFSFANYGLSMSRNWINRNF